jgi:hypothetical protein
LFGSDKKSKGKKSNKNVQVKNDKWIGQENKIDKWKVQK